MHVTSIPKYMSNSGNCKAIDGPASMRDLDVSPDKGLVSMKDSWLIGGCVH